VLGTGPASVAEAVLATVLEPSSHDPHAGRAWVDRWHSPARGVDIVSATYERVMAARS
jgi:hypothetical protein